MDDVEYRVYAMIDRFSEPAEWLASLSERVRAEGNTEHADRLLLLAWQAMDGQEVTPDMLIGARADGETRASAGLGQASPRKPSSNLHHSGSDLPMTA